METSVLRGAKYIGFVDRVGGDVESLLGCWLLGVGDVESVLGGRWIVDGEVESVLGDWLLEKWGAC